MLKHHSLDTSSQAMTEVALGLSMAFFALLIVALLSFQLPHSPPLAVEPNQSMDLAASLNIEQSKNTEKTLPGDSQFVFYFRQQFYGSDLKPRVIADYSTDIPLVLVVAQSLPFSEVMTLRNAIHHPQLSITQLSPEWQTQLEDIK